MIKFNQLPPTADTTSLDISLIRHQAKKEGGSFKAVAEDCAHFVTAHTTDLAEVNAIGEEIAEQLSFYDDPSEGAIEGQMFLDAYRGVYQILTDLGERVV